MNKTYQLKTNAIKGEQQVIDVKPAVGKAPVKLTAAAGARYELIDASTKAAPDNIRVMRKGANLQIFFDGETEPGAVIENFYQAHTDEQPTLVGTTEQGKLYEYIPESAAPSAVVAQLGDTGYAYGMALGGQELVAGTGAAVGLLAAPLVAGFSPLLLGAGALGAAALAGGGGGAGDSPSNPVIPDPNTVANTGQKTAISLNPVTVDNNISTTENTGNIALTGKVSGYFAADDVVSVYVNGKTYTGKTAADGSFSISVPAADLAADKDTKIEAKVTGTGGDTANAAQDYAVETAANAGKQTALSIDPITRDNLISASEKDDTLDITGKVTGPFAATDTITLAVNGKTFTGVPKADGTFSIPVPATDLTADSDSTVEGTIGTAASAIQNFAVDTIAPNDGKTVGLKIDLDSNADRTINGSEKGSATTTSLTATFEPSKVSVGDKVTFSDGSNSKDVTLTAADVAAGKVTSSGWGLLPDEDGARTYTAVLADPAGNTTPKAVQIVTLDAVVESLKTALSIAPITGDNLISVDEQKAATITVNGKVSGTFADGDLVTLLINGQAYTAKTSANGTFSVDVNPADLSADANRQIGGSIKGSNGGELATAAQQYAMESANTAGKVTALLIDPVTADNIINIEESKSSATTSIDVTGKVTGKFAAGDTVSLLVNNKTFSGTVDANGAYKIAVLKDDLLMDGDTTVDAFVTGTGSTSAKAMQNYGVDTTIADNIKFYIDLDTGYDTKYSNDGYINKNEKGNNDTTSLTAVFDKSNVSIGDVVTFTNIDTKETKSVLLTAEMIAEGKVTSTGWTLPSEGSKLNVEAVMKDAAGNSSAVAKDFATIDTTATAITRTKEDTEVVLSSSPEKKELQLIKVIFHPNEADGTFVLHVGDTIFSVMPSDGKLFSGNTSNLEIPANKIFFQHLDTAGNSSTTYLVDDKTTTAYFVTPNTIFQV